MKQRSWRVPYSDEPNHLDFLNFHAKFLRFVLGFAIAPLILILIVKDLDFGKILQNLKRHIFLICFSPNIFRLFRKRVFFKILLSFIWSVTTQFGEIQIKIKCVIKCTSVKLKSAFTYLFEGKISLLDIPTCVFFK